MAIEETRQCRHSLTRFGQVGILPEEVPHALEDVEIRLDPRRSAGLRSGKGQRHSGSFEPWDEGELLQQGFIHIEEDETQPAG